MNAGDSAPWVSLEGINGVGKTYLAARAARVLGNRCVPLVELPDATPALLPGQVIAALRIAGDAFLRTGHPRTETLLLAALQVHRHESTTALPGQIVLEDRGPHSVAAYQAAILSGYDGRMDETAAVRIAHTILKVMAQWRPLPQKTLLLVDDPGRCLARFEARIGQRASSDEHALMARVGRIYQLLVESMPMYVVDRRQLDEDACVAAIVNACHRAAILEETPCA